jgi:hypothetical protein
VDARKDLHPQQVPDMASSLGPTDRLVQLKRCHEPQTGRSKFHLRVTTVTALLRHLGRRKRPGTGLLMGLRCDDTPPP